VGVFRFAIGHKGFTVSLAVGDHPVAYPAACLVTMHIVKEQLSSTTPDSTADRVKWSDSVVSVGCNLECPRGVAVSGGVLDVDGRSGSKSVVRITGGEDYGVANQSGDEALRRVRVSAYCQGPNNPWTCADMRGPVALISGG
jgi:hypothetical protein